MNQFQPSHPQTLQQNHLLFISLQSRMRLTNALPCISFNSNYSSCVSENWNGTLVIVNVSCFFYTRKLVDWVLSDQQKEWSRWYPRFPFKSEVDIKIIQEKLYIFWSVCVYTTQFHSSHHFVTDKYSSKIFHCYSKH